MRLKNIAVMALLVGTLAGCKKTWLDVNTNPNALPSSTPDFLFTNGLTRMAFNSLNPNELGSYYSGQWTQSSSYILSPTIFSYLFTNSDFNYWDGWYDILSDFNYAEQNAAAYDQEFIQGPSRIMKAYIYQQIVDVYGNAPYSEALKGGSLLIS